MPTILSELSAELKDRYFTKAAKSRGEAEKVGDEKTEKKRMTGISKYIKSTHIEPGPERYKRKFVKENKTINSPVRINNVERNVKTKDFHMDYQKLLSGRMNIADFKKRNGVR
jgi:hypothetical protein